MDNPFKHFINQLSFVKNKTILDGTVMNLLKNVRKLCFSQLKVMALFWPFLLQMRLKVKQGYGMKK